MKKSLFAKVALAGLVGAAAALVSGTADAAICSACHTMHNSQDGSPITSDGSPKQILLTDTCFGCHSGVNDTTTIGDPTQAPYVIGDATINYSGAVASGTAGRTLAGGDFYWVTQGNQYGHSISDATFPGVGADATLNVAPGGTKPSATLTCAGINGCHGDRTLASTGEGGIGAMNGAHHAGHNNATDVLTLADTGHSYRFLNGTDGREDTDWQFTEAANEHNVYSGSARSDDTAQATTVVDTISSLCASCHPSFHNETAGRDTHGINDGTAGFSSGSWVRHPTDYSMADTASGTEFAGYAAYQFDAPVGATLTTIQTAGAVSDATIVSSGQRIVVCMSCHRAHGSPYADALRWNYNDMIVGDSTKSGGCFACHTYKNQP